jgi:Ni/Fe-hydrogenase subunit HybB-like protein
MVIFESILASKSFRLKPEMDVLSKLGSLIGPILGIYLAFKVGDMFIRESFKYINGSFESWMYLIELVVGIIIPMILFFRTQVLKSVLGLFIASACVIFGVLLNRINNFIVAYDPPYEEVTYVPSFGEISVTVGLIALLVLVYRFIVMNFPVISIPAENHGGQK